MANTRNPNSLLLFLQDFVFGFSLPLKSFRLLLSTPRLLALSSLPFGISAFIAYLLLSRGSQAAQEAIKRYFEVWGLPQEGLAALGAQILVSTLAFLVGALSFNLLATLASSPFNDFLAEASEKQLPTLSRPAETRSFKQYMRILATDAIKSLATAAAGVFAIVTAWIPGLGLMSGVITCGLISFQFVSYPQTRRNINLRTSLSMLLRRPGAAISFGLAHWFLFSIPLASAFFIPLAVIGGTLLFSRIEPTSARV